jgi:hypothetical protein
VYIVAREHRELFDDLGRRLAADASAEVLYDRRRSERRRAAAGWPEERRRAQRRVRDDLELALQALGYAALGPVTDPA